MELLLSIINYETTLITSQPQCTANNGVPSLGTCNQIVVDGSIITLGTAEALFTLCCGITYLHKVQQAQVVFFK